MRKPRDELVFSVREKDPFDFGGGDSLSEWTEREGERARRRRR